MYTLGQANLSTFGDGIVKNPNYADAAKWFEMGAKKGHTPSMYWLTKIGGITNEERVMWLKKGAELGNGACVTALINSYSEGLYGLPVDSVEAFRWTKRGWEMDFEERHYDTEMKVKEMTRLLTTYRAHLRIGLSQRGKTKEEAERILEQIR